MGLKLSHCSLSFLIQWILNARYRKTIRAKGSKSKGPSLSGQDPSHWATHFLACLSCTCSTGLPFLVAQWASFKTTARECPEHCLAQYLGIWTFGSERKIQVQISPRDLKPGFPIPWATAMASRLKSGPLLPADTHVPRQSCSTTDGSKIQAERANDASRGEIGFSPLWVACVGCRHMLPMLPS